MNKWIFSFGVGTPMRNYCVYVEGTYEEARDKMVEVFGIGWCAQYTLEEFEEKEWGKDKVRIHLV